MLNDRSPRPWIMTFCLAAVAVAVTLSGGSLVRAAEDGPRVAKNPYADVNWERVNAYRANFHSHTVLSDGRAEPDELIYLYAEAGYHILALSDHDNFYRHREGERDVMAKYVHRDEHTRVPTSETTWPWTRWIDEEPSQIWAYGGMESSAFYPDLGPEGMLAVRAAELTTHPHIVSLFNPCGWPDRGQSEEERLACIEAHDGLAFWAHPTHYVPGGPIEKFLFDDTDWEEAIDYFGRYLVEHDVLLGFEMRDHGDRIERDVKLLDHLLARHYREHDIFVNPSPPKPLTPSHLESNFLSVPHQDHWVNPRVL